uniref:Urease accessory protein F n=1 Tax=Tanacetum cinerariifolium TaxID=118510 RepID=A0A6L2JQQ1_TANCI|nr:urease accessory protein F [Tanacetum cinerariifolium]
MILDATLINEISRKASVSQGSALIRVSSSVFIDIPSLKMMRSVSLSNGDVRFHHAPIFGLVCRLLGFDSETSQRAYMFTTMRDIISAATRLNLVGPLGADVLQHQKLRLLDLASLYANSRLDAIIVETLILASDRDQLLPSRQEGDRLHRLLSDFEFCIFDDSSYILFMDTNHDMVTILKATSIYRRTRNVDYVEACS